MSTFAQQVSFRKVFFYLICRRFLTHFNYFMRQRGGVFYKIPRFSCAVAYYGVTMNMKELSGDPYVNATTLALLEILSNVIAIIVLR